LTRKAAPSTSRANRSLTLPTSISDTKRSQRSPVNLDYPIKQVVVGCSTPLDQQLVVAHHGRGPLADLWNTTLCNLMLEIHFTA
jgi:hypothetical protein